MAARFKVIVLEKDPGAPHYTYVLWADVPTARQALYAAAWGPTRVSAWKDATNGAGSDNEKLQNRSVVERQQSIDAGVAPQSLAGRANLIFLKRAPRRSHRPGQARSIG